MTSSVVAWIGAEMEFALSQAVASGDAFEHRPSECGHCVQNFLADLDFRDLPGEAAGFELGADDTLPTAALRFYPAALVVPCGHPQTLAICGIESQYGFDQLSVHLLDHVISMVWMVFPNHPAKLAHHFTGNPDHQRLKSLCISIRTHLLGRGYDVFHPTTGEASFFNHELPIFGLFREY